MRATGWIAARLCSPSLYPPRIPTLVLLDDTETLNVGNYFDYEGHFDEWGLGDAVKKLVGRLEKRVRDKKKKEKKEK